MTARPALHQGDLAVSDGRKFLGVTRTIRARNGHQIERVVYGCAENVAVVAPDTADIVELRLPLKPIMAFAPGDAIKRPQRRGEATVTKHLTHDRRLLERVEELARLASNLSAEANDLASDVYSEVAAVEMIALRARAPDKDDGANAAKDAATAA